MWYSIRATARSSADIAIYDEVGKGGITADAFRKHLHGLGRVAQLDISINSPGGSVFDGFAIFNLLKAHPARKVVRIDGVAASIASYIAMSGDEVVMPENAMMMLHDPSGLVLGGAQRMRGLAEMLDKVKEGMVSAYVARSGKSRAEVAQLMSEETWYSAAEAVAARFADRVEEPVRLAAVHDLSAYKRPPSPKTMAELANAFWGRKPPKDDAPPRAETVDTRAIYARFNAR